MNIVYAMLCLILSYVSEGTLSTMWAVAAAILSIISIITDIVEIRGNNESNN